MNDLLAETPRYVLLNDKLRLCPELLPTQGGPACTAIYGFSDKQPYDLFCANCDLPLTPYPLVKGYLKKQIADSDGCIQLVVVDATGPLQIQMNAATMNLVLEAQEQNANQVAVSFRLTLDPASKAYLVEKARPELEVSLGTIESQ